MTQREFQYICWRFLANGENQYAMHQYNTKKLRRLRKLSKKGK